jgi:hypothetical protein
VREAKSLDARAGVWFALPAAHDSLGWQDTRSDWFQRNAATGETFGDPNGASSIPTHPGVQRHIAQNIAAARADGLHLL